MKVMWWLLQARGKIKRLWNLTQKKVWIYEADFPPYTFFVQTNNYVNQFLTLTTCIFDWIVYKIKIEKLKK